MQQQRKRETKQFYQIPTKTTTITVVDDIKSIPYELWIHKILPYLTDEPNAIFSLSQTCRFFAQIFSTDKQLLTQFPNAHYFCSTECAHQMFEHDITNCWMTVEYGISSSNDFVAMEYDDAKKAKRAQIYNSICKSKKFISNYYKQNKLDFILFYHIEIDPTECMEWEEYEEKKIEYKRNKQIIDDDDGHSYCSSLLCSSEEETTLHSSSDNESCLTDDEEMFQKLEQKLISRNFLFHETHHFVKHIYTMPCGRKVYDVTMNIDVDDKTKKCIKYILIIGSDWFEYSMLGTTPDFIDELRNEFKQQQAGEKCRIVNVIGNTRDYIFQIYTENPIDHRFYSYDLSDALDSPHGIFHEIIENIVLEEIH